MKYTITKLWLLLKNRPLITCPFCKGAGGAMSGYYEPEWSECSECWHYWEQLDDYGINWTTGRMPVWQYVRARASMWCGLWFAASIRQLIACRIGRHRWINEDQTDKGLRVCCVCYEHKYENQPTN